MDKFKELSLEELQEIDGGSLGSDPIAWVGYYAHKAWCDLKNAYYDLKKTNNMRGEYNVMDEIFGY